ncbi:MAG: hypothetical protein OES57_06825 [Acidimicrobiia bacterium]|nr:hypothetical protein [Acidimicrobiia bacterium]
MGLNPVAYAVVHHDPPEVYLATDIDILHRVLAFELVARTSPATLPAGLADGLRQALLEERWGDAVVDWISHTGVAVDVYTSLHVNTDADLPADLIGAQLQFTPLFRDSDQG